MDLADVLDVLPDPRSRQGRRYRLGALLALCTITVLAGATTLVAVARHAAHLPEEIRDRLGLRAAPRATTLGRVLARLDGDTVDAAIGAWLALHCTLPGESDDLCAVAVDGKTLRGSRTVTRRAVHLVAAATHGERAALNQRQVPGKKGEISAFVPLLARLDLAGWTVTFDALHTQHAHARFVVEVKNAHYIAIVKDNHPKLHAFLKRLPWAEIPLGHYCRERAHGRDEIRRLKATAVPRRLRFPHAVQALKVTRRRRNNGTGKIEIERIYAVTSHTAHTATDAQLARAVREHWHIEAHHHVPDTTRPGPRRGAPWRPAAGSPQPYRYARRALPCRRPQPRVAPSASPSTGPGVLCRHLVSAQGLRQGPCGTTRRDTIGGRKELAA
ncbi:ISAs1 family transposase [Streptomyces sp. NPDC005065]|uniref:ISAs1 family transposase n=1 Tax=Streptomyces sp. NPDC005065 TaxID=3154461 RepID=UPI00339FBE33